MLLGAGTRRILQHVAKGHHGNQEALQGVAVAHHHAVDDGDEDQRPIITARGKICRIDDHHPATGYPRLIGPIQIAEQFPDLVTLLDGPDPATEVFPHPPIPRDQVERGNQTIAVDK